MTKLVVDDTWTYIEGYCPTKAIDEVTSYRVHGRWFASSFRNAHWDGIKRFRVKDRRRECYKFPTGLLPRVVAQFEKIHLGYELEDHRELETPESCYQLEGGIRLDDGIYDYQAPLLDAALMHGRGIVKAATGAGKTEVGAAIIKCYDKPTLWLTHLRVLLYQTRERLERRLGVKVGIVGDGKWEPETITVAMVPTLTRKRSKKEEFDKFTIHRKRVAKLIAETELLIADEVHHLTSARWVSVFERSTAPYRIGLTATPCFDGPGLALEAWTGPVVAEINAGELIERGVLVRPDIWFVRPGCERVEKHLTYPAVYSQGIVHNKRRNDLIVHVARIFQAEAKPAITLVRRINHGKLLVDQMENRGMKAFFLEGRVKHQDRVRLLEGLWDGSVDHLVAQSTLLGEGVDMPQLRAVINACGTRAGGSPDSDNPGEIGRGTIQFLGRGLRRAPGKTSFEFVDLADDHHKFLKAAARERVAALESEGYAPFIRYWADRPAGVVA